MHIHRGNGVTLWKQILQSLEQDIREGILAPGDRIPTEFELASKFSVNRHTARRALAELEKEGLIRVEQGRGRFVQENIIDYVVGKRTRFSENLNRQSRTPGGVLLRGVELNAPDHVAKGLAIAPGLRVILLETIGKADERVISFGSHYFSARHYPGFIAVYKESNSITTALKKYGIYDYFRKWTKVTTRLPSAEEARHLDQSRSRPVLIAESVNIDPNQRPIEYCVTRFASDWVQLVVEY